MSNRIVQKLCDDKVISKISVLINEPVADIKEFFSQFNCGNDIEYHAYIDGGARGNPGPAGIGFIINDSNNNEIYKDHHFFNNLTNNQAEYQALLLCLKKCVELNIKNIVIFSDSQLLVKQINGIFRVKNDKLIDLFMEVSSMIAKFDSFKMIHIKREHNKKADILANRAMDFGLRDST